MHCCNDDKSVFVLVMTWCPAGYKRLSESMLTKTLTEPKYELIPEIVRLTCSRINTKHTCIWTHIQYRKSCGIFGKLNGTTRI